MVKPTKGPAPDRAEEFLDPAEILLKSQIRVESLEATLAQHVKDLRVAHTEEEELRQKCVQLENDYLAVKQERFDVISDFTRQHKALQDELVGRLTHLENTITDLNDQLDLSKLALSETKKEKDQYIAQREKEIQDQEEKMKEMEAEFEQMVKETLESMSKKISETEQDNTIEAALTSSVTHQGDSAPLGESPWDKT